MSAARLSKKIQAAPEGAYGNLLESFVSVGTPLPSLADTGKGKGKDANEFKPLWQQEVVDEQGRRRLHGAFTGGFSAGYFNTVGSKEGWTPSTFKSSRDSRANKDGKSTLDAAKAYMDAEDLEELASSRQLETSSKYSAAPATKPTYDPLLGIFSPSVSAAPAAAVPDATAHLASLIAPSESRIGAKLMRKMGWREGQGVGPRLTWEGRRSQALELGFKLPAEEDAGEEERKHYFAPLDRPLMVLGGAGPAADRGWGLGYKPGPNMEQALGAASAMREGGAMPTMDVEEEDDDPYAVGPSIESLVGGQKKRIGVIELGDEDDDDLRMGGSRRRRPARAAPQAQSQSFIDGTRVLSGFQILDERTYVPSTSHLPPAPPKGWEPSPRRVWSEAEAAESGKASEGKGEQRGQMDAEQRGTLLGEPAPPPVPKSVFDYLSARSKSRLDALTNPTSSASSSTTPTPTQTTAEPEVALEIPPLDASTAHAALRGFQPFGPASTAPDRERQARYELYLRHCAGLLPPLPNTTLPFGPRTLLGTAGGRKQTIAELNRELNEYAQAARVFRPVEGMLAGRFTSGSSAANQLGAQTVAPGLYQPPPKPLGFVSGGVQEDGKGSEKEEILTPAQTAARAGLYGPGTTREVRRFRPLKLVCKRFGVRDPWEGVAEGEEENEDVGGAWGEASANFSAGGGRAGGATKEALGKGSMEALMQSAGFRKFQPAAEEQPPSGMQMDNDPPLEDFDHTPISSAPLAATNGNKPAIKPTLDTVGLGDDERQGEEILLQEKAPKDIFAAIFADSDDESDDEDEQDEAGSGEKEGNGTAPTIAVQEGILETLKDASGSEPTATAEPEPIADIQLDTSTIADYRPAFVPSASRTSKETDKDKDKSKSKKKKRKAATLSFDVEDGEGDGGAEVITKKKKVRSGAGEKEREKPRVEEEDEWGEAPSSVHPEILKATAKSSAPSEGAAAGAGGRSKASDLF